MLEWQWLALFLIGLGTGIYGVLVGAGGGFIISPILLSFFGVPPSVVAGTSLALVSINTVSGSFTYWRMGLVDKRSGLLFAFAAIPGSVIAPFFITKVSVDTFQIVLGILLLLVAAQIAWRDKLNSTADKIVKKVEVDTSKGFMTAKREIKTTEGAVYRYSFNEPAATIFNFALGFMSSFFGTGGGFLRTPILINIFGFPVQVAVATSVFALGFYTTAGAITHVVFGNVQWWPIFVFAGAGLVLGGQIGARLTGRIRGAWILRLLLIVLLGLGLRLMLQGFGIG